VANFKTHFVIGALGSGVLSSSLLTLQMVDSKEAIVAFAVGTLASLAPDIDANNSKPLKIASTVIAIVISFFTVFAQAGRISIVEMVLFWLFLFFIIRFVFMLLFQSVTVHRGVFHSVVMAVLLGEIAVLIFYHFYGFEIASAYLLGFIFFFGYILHLVLDELVSVNLFGMSYKRSLGSATKFFDKKTPILYLLLYFTCFVIYLFLPPYEPLLLELVKLENFFSIWWPKDGWFDF